MASTWVAVVLAAGKGARMRSRIPKVLHPVCGQPMLLYPLNAVRDAGVKRRVVVASPENQAHVTQLLGDSVEYAYQSRPLGTGHALLQAMPLLRGQATHLLVTNGDLPLIRSETLAAMMSLHRGSRAAVTILTSRATPVQAMGRVVRDSQGNVTTVVEEADATGPQQAIQEMNAGAYCFRASWLWRNLPLLIPSGKGELYITSLVGVAAAQGERVEALAATEPWEAQGVNNRIELARVEGVLRQRIRERWMLAGVTILDPSTTYIDASVELAEDTVVLPNTMLLGATQVGGQCRIGPNAMIRDSAIGERCVVIASVLEEATLEAGVTIGPFSHLRPGAYLEAGVHLGNFAEVKNSRLGRGVQMGHFGYVGDADIGEGVNLGAGAITCNFDGSKKNRTVVEEGAFIGSDTMLVAPVRVGARARTGAGAVVIRDVPPDSLAVGVPARIVKGKRAPVS
ncbi:MAG: bifunctional UDP-N-acetylglucosamine diphosphorylase/glucosamine-1-phosphate N-acetyltransferase GlmU [Chloroflexota bacterium]|nr:bifunctional UDP-N-acetylglucosamine diphosphorylase/glucosamine-1-phosphate N-acetyltransferase GlmU [Chloroflexota bacterium]